MYPRHEVFGDLPESEVVASLNACVLASKDEYTDDEVYRFIECRQLIEKQGKTYDEAKEHFRLNGIVTLSEPQSTTSTQSTASSPQTPAKKPKTKKSSRNISELRSLAIETTLTQIRLTEVIGIMELCGLSPDQEQYTLEECDRFLMACDLIFKQSLSHAQVAAHFGYHTEVDTSLEQSLVQNLDEAADLIESNVSSISDEMMQQRASGQALADTQRYLSYYVQAVRSGQETKEFWHRLRTHAKTRLEGKAQARLNRAEEPTTLILPFSPSSTTSSENSENGTTDE